MGPQRRVAGRCGRPRRPPPGSGFAFEVASAGTHALVGNRMDAGSARLLGSHGIAHVVSRWTAVPGIIAAHAPGRRSAADVPDPFTNGDAAFDGMAATIGPAVRTIVEWESTFPR